MNAPIVALALVLSMILGAMIALAVSHQNTTQSDAERCVNNGGKPIRADGTTYCLDARLFVPN